MFHRLTCALPFLSVFTLGCIKPLSCVELLQCATPRLSADADAATDTKYAYDDASADVGLPSSSEQLSEDGAVPMVTGSSGHQEPTGTDGRASERSSSAISSPPPDAGGGGESQTPTACNDGWYRSGVDGGACAPWRTCESGTYVSLAGSAKDDRHVCLAQQTPTPWQRTLRPAPLATTAAGLDSRVRARTSATRLVAVLM